MEADWEFEVGGDAPVIDACWAGFVDLRGAAYQGEMAVRIGGLAEVGLFPALGNALERLNSRESPVWTSKCDFWPELGAEDFDPDEMDALAGSVGHVLGCYIDLLSKTEERWRFLPGVEADCRSLCARMRAAPLRCCRAELIVRRAVIAPGAMDHGITAYFTACGSTADEAAGTLASALGVLADALFGYSKIQ